MPPENTTAIFWVLNCIFAVFFGVAGWYAKVLWSAVQKLREDLNQLAVHIAQDYTPTTRFDTALNQVFSKLDHIIEMLNGKADRK